MIGLVFFTSDWLNISEQALKTVSLSGQQPVKMVTYQTIIRQNYTWIFCDSWSFISSHKSSLCKNGSLTHSWISCQPPLQSLLLWPRECFQTPPYSLPQTPKSWSMLFISSRLDYWNVLLIRISSKNLQKLQYIQNSAARVMMMVFKHELITPVLHSLHLLSSSRLSKKNPSSTVFTFYFTTET